MASRGPPTFRCCRFLIVFGGRLSIGLRYFCVGRTEPAAIVDAVAQQQLRIEKMIRQTGEQRLYRLEIARRINLFAEGLAEQHPSSGRFAMRVKRDDGCYLVTVH